MFLCCRQPNILKTNSPIQSFASYLSTLTFLFKIKRLAFYLIYEYFVNGDRQGKYYYCHKRGTIICTSNWHLTVTHSKGQGQAHFYFISETVTDMSIVTIAIKYKLLYALLRSSQETFLTVKVFTDCFNWKANS